MTTATATDAGAQRARVFLAHPINLDDARLTALKAAVAEVAAREIEQGVEIVLGRDDFNEQFAAQGGWDGWTASVAEGTVPTFAGPRPRFAAVIVAPGREVGKATAQIIKLTLRTGKLVLFFDQGTASLHRIVGVVRTDPDDFRAGWTVDIR